MILKLNLFVSLKPIQSWSNFSFIFMKLRMWRMFTFHGKWTWLLCTCCR